MRARHCPEKTDPADDCYLGDMVAMEAKPATFRKVPPYDPHWQRRGLIVVIGVVAVWSAIICWAAG